LPNRFIFRQVHFEDLPTFLVDGEVRAKRHQSPQGCHQTSYQEIVSRRETDEFELPNGCVVNDFVPFYFSPITSFTFTIYKGNVPLVSPGGAYLCQACEDDRIFLVSSPHAFVGSDLFTCFSNYALNSRAPMPTIETDLTKLEEHVHWNVFDEAPKVAAIPEINYGGVCRYFNSMATPPERMTRSPKRMAEFLVHGAVPLDKVMCIVVKTDAMRTTLGEMMTASAWDIPILTQRGCFYG
jgi:ssDNA thymidine ADP-ribosyltransferase, DarT